MPNSQTQIDAFEYIGIEAGTGGNSHPSVAVRQGFFFGWGGSGLSLLNAGRSSTLVTALAVRFQLIEEVLTIAAAATTDSVTTNLLPANSILHHILGRVTVVIPTAATFTVGDATTPTRFKSGVAVAATTTFVGLDHCSGAVTTLPAGPTQAADAKIRITPNLTPGAATGVVALQVFSETGIPPTA